MAGNRHAVVSSPFGESALFHRMTARQELGRLFDFRLEILSKTHNLALESALGEPFSIELTTRDGHERFFHGIATSAAHIGTHGDHALYHVVLSPWLWLLTRTMDCRIYQDKSIPEIVKEVFTELGFTNFKDELTGSYPTRKYTVQYRESDFNFVSRLMEHVGIYYYFEHTKTQHTLVMADALAAHSVNPYYDVIAYHPPSDLDRREKEHFNDVRVSFQVQPGAYVVDSYDFEKPKANMQVNSVKPRAHSHSKYEVFDFPADYTETGEGSTYANVRLEEFQARHELITAAGDTCALQAGELFTLGNHPREALNGQFLIVSSTHEIVMHGYETGAGLEMSDTMSIECIESSQQFRSEEVTPKPVIYGPQTAVVVGKQGEEIWTEGHGRVKVQFHWDRLGKNDENSSCWLRVSQGWAGKGWGQIHLPRIGQEVIVDFISGDPDQPIVTGRVYNNDNKVPYDLPANQTQSGIKSRSTKGGSADHFNELRFEDKKGQELIYFHAEKDFDRLVEDNDTLTVEEGDRSVEIKKGDDSLVIKKGDRTTLLELGAHKTEAKKSIELIVGQSSILLDQSGITLKALKITIQGQVSCDMKAAMTTVSGDATLTLKGGLVLIN